jgi:hypothetical protein
MDPMSTMLEEQRQIAIPAVTVPAWTRRSYALLAGVLLVSTVVIVHRIHIGEFNYNVDETQHAMTGVFVSDLIRAHPITHLVDYTYQYYAQYPALSGVIHWPPLFYLFEGLSFLLFGQTVVAARLTILGFALLAIIFWFALVRKVQDEWMAAGAALLLACAPSVLLFEKAVMLEIPCLAFSLAAIFFWTRYLLQESTKDVYLSALFASAALLTKQNAVFLLAFFVFSALSVAGWRLFLRRAVLGAAALGAVLIAPFYGLVYLVHWKTIAMDLTEKGASKAHQVGFYWKAIPNQLGWVIILLAILGIITCKWWARAKLPAIMLSWIAACYITFTVIGHKEARYALYWVPPFIYFALGPLLCYFRRPALRIAGGVAAVLLIGTTVVYGWSYQRPYISGYQTAAERVTSMSKSGVILYDAPLPGNFIFFVRANDPDRRFLVLRKLLYATRLKLGGGSVELVHSREQIEDQVRVYGVRYIVVSDGTPLNFESQRILRDLLKDPRFRLAGTFHIDGNELRSNINLLLYENVAWAPPTEKLLRIKMLTIDHDIVVPMDRFNLGDESGPGAKNPQSGAQAQ